jgi:predicted RNA-binding Zn ribbon-like protein
MVIKASRVRKTEKPHRIYQGEAKARFLVNLLNQWRMIPLDSLRGIMLALQKLGECQSMSRQRLLRKQLPQIEAMNKILRRYQARPRLRLLSPGDGFRLEWQRIGDDDLELWGVLTAVELAQEGRIAKLKKCANPNCKRWLFARFKHQRFCSVACHEMFHRTDEADKERRRKWAKNNYQSHKELELGSRKAAQTKGGKK